MKKFTTVTRKKEVEEPTSKDALYSGNYLSVVDIEGWETVQEKDCVIVLPHFTDFDEIILRKEDIPPFKSRDKQNFFLTAVSGTVEEGEEPLEAAIRELEEEAGVQLHTTYKAYKLWGSFFMTKGNTAKYHLYYMPMKSTDYQKVAPKGDGSESENKSTSVRVNIQYLDSLNPSDTVTALVINYTKNELANILRYKF